MIRPSLIDLYPAELNYFPFMISLNEFNGIYNVDDLSINVSICVPGKIKDINIKVFLFHMIARINEVKTLIKHISCECKCKFDSTTCNSNQR